MTRLAAPSRAYWSETIHCKDCGKPRPWFLAAKNAEGGLSSVRCIPCQKERNRLRMKKSRELRSKEKIRQDKIRDLARKQFFRPSLRRCRDTYYRIRKRNPKSIPKWVTIESLVPIYEYAELLDEEFPEFSHAVEHINSIAKDKSVCGLHTIDNLQIVRCKRVNGKAFCPIGLTSPKNK